MKGRIINSVLIFAAAIFLTVLAIHVRTGATADSVAVLKTAGMTCDSCSTRISKTLQTLNGVASTEVDVAAGYVIVGYDTKAVKPEVLAEKVRGAGFESQVQEVLTPERFKQITGRSLGKKTAASKGCCGGCNAKQQNESPEKEQK